ncbi:hypothetical protein QWY93_15245 [Echinicola jeungdonensis]|uniref:Uncharacterized protein n=1 Tax=Echinicola jeungdonensis TaxID=709343 RepID=A0ABV5J363_9BACT|nr:hypothetical protein [Echinicola jeungdonensis]MDN3670678.1 hypothetical protein [Echinicola jeungdonensis]
MNHKNRNPHQFHIPVMGLGYTVDSPLKVARFGISSVVSIMEDELIEQMRKVYSQKLNLPFTIIDQGSKDARAKRITAYLDLLDDIIQGQIKELKEQPFGEGKEVDQYFEMLPSSHWLSIMYNKMKTAGPEDRVLWQKLLRRSITPGSVDVNIMTKVDKLSYDENGQPLPREFSDGLAALRGFAQSKLNASVVFSAGLNPALFSYTATFGDFFPDKNGDIKKKIILKVSDFRSALIQGKFLAKKGLWVSEFRVESGLNCGGHAFATDGMLMGPILEEFKTKREELSNTLWDLCKEVWNNEGKQIPQFPLNPKITAQGGIGNSMEQQFLLDYYSLDGTGWGSPFLMVPEATSVDNETLQKLVDAKKEDFYLSHASPLGVPFNNLRTSSAEKQRKERIAKNRPGSPCYKKVLSSNTEFTDQPICTASRQYQHLKLKQLKKDLGDNDQFQEKANQIMEKDCLCEGLGAPALLANGTQPPRNLNAVTICPGPNLAYFKGIYSLKEMVDHIYGKANLKLDPQRPQMFIKELQLYVDYFKKEVQKYVVEQSPKLESYLDRFRNNLLDGMQYYQELFAGQKDGFQALTTQLKNELTRIQKELEAPNMAV